MLIIMMKSIIMIYICSEPACHDHNDSNFDVLSPYDLSSKCIMKLHHRSGH